MKVEFRSEIEDPYGVLSPESKIWTIGAHEVSDALAQRLQEVLGERVVGLVSATPVPKKQVENTENLPTGDK